jgi:hypothetical protein
MIVGCVTIYLLLGGILMSRKSLFAASTLALVTVGTAAAVYLLSKKEKESEDEEMHFITLEDGEGMKEEKEEKEESVKTYSAEGKSEEVQEVSAVYPYLDPDFIEKLLAKNDEFNASYEDDVLVTIKHRVKFDQAEERKAFIDIMEISGYETSSKDDIVVASRKFFTQPGAIISDILNVANQTNALQGVYEDFDVQ